MAIRSNEWKAKMVSNKTDGTKAGFIRDEGIIPHKLQTYGGHP